MKAIKLFLYVSICPVTLRYFITLGPGTKNRFSLHRPQLHRPHIDHIVGLKRVANGLLHREPSCSHLVCSKTINQGFEDKHCIKVNNE